VADVEINPYKDADGAPQLRPSVAASLDILGYKDYIDKAFSEGNGQKELVRLRTALDVAYQHLKIPVSGPIFDGKQNFQVHSFGESEQNWNHV
jgi:hypothetical protein